MVLGAAQRLAQGGRSGLLVECNNKKGLGVTLRGTRRCVPEACRSMAAARETGWAHGPPAACCPCAAAMGLALTRICRSGGCTRCCAHPPSTHSLSACRKRARVSGFRARMATPGGRKVLAARRKVRLVG